MRKFFISQSNNIAKKGDRMPLFGKKRESPGTAGTPTDLVLQMRSQGLSNNQIIATLQREGYSSSQIFDAMTQADIKGTVIPPAQMQEEQMMMPQQQPIAPMAPMPPQEYMQPPVAEVPRAQIEEVAETIIEEKWDDLMKAVEKIAAWKDNAENRLAKMEQGIEDLRKNFEQLQSGVLGKVSEYDQGIRDVGVEIKAMEEVFKKVLPSFTENIGELGKITRAMKKK